MVSQLPARIRVTEVVSSRYPGNKKPLSWDARVQGFDRVRAEDGSTYNLLSDGGQSPPQPGWDLMLTTVQPDGSYTWTLYGLAR